MNIVQKMKLLENKTKNSNVFTVAGLFLIFLVIKPVSAEELSITNLDFSALVGNKIQIVLEMTGEATEPDVFQTDNPARIALDFVGVKSGLKQKKFTPNMGAANDIYVIEAGERTRVVINLSESVPYETKVLGNKVLITLNNVKSVAETVAPMVRSPTRSQKAPVDIIARRAPTEAFSPAEPEYVVPQRESAISRLLPQQTIRDIDFKRGANGEGLLLVELTNVNTIVDSREVGGKVVLKFLNTRLPQALRKRFDVSDFATPIHKIEAVSRGINTIITITPMNGNYDYSSFQDGGMLTFDFRPLTYAEKEQAQKAKFPYSGEKLSLNFQDIEIRAVLQILADFTELNIVASDAISGRVTLNLNDVPWDQALDLILKANGLAKREAGNVILVAPTSQIFKLEEEELEAKKVTEQLEPLRTEYIQINYARVNDIKKILLGSRESERLTVTTNQSEDNKAQRTSKENKTQSINERLLSRRGIVNADVRTNVLIVKDTVKNLESIRAMIQKLDIPVRQVMIEARIVNADKNFARDLGMRFGIAKAARLGSKRGFAVGPAPTVGGLITRDVNGVRTGGGVVVPSVSDANVSNYLVDLASKGANAFPPAALGMTLARAADYVLNLEISALEGENRGELISNPRVLTSDRVEAVIKQGVQIPFSTTSSEGTQTEFIDAVLELKVTPQITPNGSVIMDLAIKNDTANDLGGIDKEEVKTTVQVNDGETVVLGGIYAMDTGKVVTKVPFFGDLPIVGILFRNTRDSEVKKELLVFITPKVVKDSVTLE
ncbi:MAG: type IV pilus secretin PilQ [Methylococcales bacterium]|nr:type IV pilus secretin PilQ [Methylococcales bacterium]